MSRLFSPAKTTFQILTERSNLTLPIQIAAPEIKAENLPLSTWTASVVLAGQLHKFKFSLPVSTAEDDSSTIPVLELGAGTGLVGLSAACLWKTTTILTDLEPIVPGLAANIVLNKDTMSKFGGSAACGSLDWSRPEFLNLSSTESPHGVLVPSSRKARVVLAADTIYDSDHPELLTDAIFEWMEKSTGARLCICYPLRVAYLDEIRELWQRLEDGGLESVTEGKEMHVGDSPNGDDEALCEWSVWRWRDEKNNLPT